MTEIIKSELIYKTIKNLVLLANTRLPKEDYTALSEFYQKEKNPSSKIAMSQILQNAKIAYDEKRPLCQDTGFVTVFINMGQNISVVGGNLEKTINRAVADAYTEFSLRKSIVDDSLFKRKNTKNNTPVLIHTDIVEGSEMEIIVSTKGGGCENISAGKMLTLAHGIEGVKDFILDTVKNAGSKPCPPIKVGIGIGSNFEGSAILSKKALFTDKKSKGEYKKLEAELLKEINKLKIGAMGLGGKSTCFGVKILSAPCHIASLPVAISISCHSSRHASATISGNNVVYKKEDYEFFVPPKTESNVIKINANDTEKIRNLPVGANIELSGKIYTARDAAHKRFDELLMNGKELPFELKDAIIFYAGPCPAAKGEAIGPIGPTTSARMDKFTPLMYKNGMLASIGKGERSQDVIAFIRAFKGKYFTMTGGVASLMKSCVKSAKVIAYPELGAEAVYELEVENLPLIVKY
ncbi:MAG: fumarate hydratase [bacterium]|nr:fumarate hydratase [bacterium]